MKYWIFGLLVLIVACNGKQAKDGIAGAGKPIGKALTANAIVLKPKSIDNKIVATGTLLPFEEIEIKPEISGKIIKLNFSEGSKVSKGQLLVKLNDKDLKAQLAKVEASLAFAKKDEARKKQMLDKNAASKEEYDKAESTLMSLEAEASLIRAQIEKTEIYAPFAGVIGLRNVSEGANITGSTKIADLIQTDPLKIEFSIPEKHAQNVKVGTEISFSLSDDKKEYKANVYATEGSIDPASRTYKVRAKISNSNGNLKAGSFVKIEILLQRIENTVVVPSSAIINELTGNKVYSVENGIARVKDIKIGIRNENDVQILEGVSFGETLLTSGLLQVKDKMPVKIKK